MRLPYCPIALETGLPCDQKYFNLLYLLSLGSFPSRSIFAWIARCLYLQKVYSVNYKCAFILLTSSKPCLAGCGVGE
jgi:hypothetical protein